MKICLEQLLHETTKPTFVFFMRLKQRICTICDKIHWHHRLIPCILSKSADPKLIWGYYLDRFSPDENIVLSRQLKAIKHTLTFFFIIILYSLGLCMVACRYLTLHHNERVELDSSYFPFFSYYIIDVRSSILLK